MTGVDKLPVLDTVFLLCVYKYSSLFYLIREGKELALKISLRIMTRKGSKAKIYQLAFKLFKSLSIFNSHIKKYSSIMPHKIKLLHSVVKTWEDYLS